MNRIEFLTELRKKLKRLPQAEQDNALRFYDEYLLEAGLENEAEAIQKLGSPSAVAAKIIGEFAVSNNNKKEKGLWVLWITMLGVFASPVALPVAIALIVTIVALLIAIVATIVSFAAAGAGIAVGGIALLLAGVIMATQSFPTAMLTFGTGLFMVALGIMLVIALIKLLSAFVTGLQKGLGKMLIKKGSNA